MAALAKRLVGMATALLAAGSIAGEEPLLDTARRLAASQDNREQQQALRLLGRLARVGDVQGELALACYGNLCLRIGNKEALERARRAFRTLDAEGETEHQRRGVIGVARLMASDGRRDQAIQSLEQFVAASTHDGPCIEAAY